MKKFRHISLFFASFFMLSLVSCDNDEDDISPNVSLLTAGEWAGSAVLVNGVDRTNELDWSNYSALFERDGNYSYYYKDTTLVEEGVWEYENDERVILFNQDTDDEYRVVISKLDEDELWYIQSGIEVRLER